MRHPRGRLNVSRLPGRHSGNLPAAQRPRAGPTGRERESGRCRVARRVGAAHPL